MADILTNTRGRLPDIITLPMEAGEDILGGLFEPQRNLAIALLAITQAATKAKGIAQLAPDQQGAQVWYQGIGDPLTTAAARVEETLAALESTHKQIEAFWRSADEIRQLYRQGKLFLG